MDTYDRTKSIAASLADIGRRIENLQRTLSKEPDMKIKTIHNPATFTHFVCERVKAYKGALDPAYPQPDPGVELYTVAALLGFAIDAYAKRYHVEANDVAEWVGHTAARHIRQINTPEDVAYIGNTLLAHIEFQHRAMPVELVIDPSR